jgi:hypothetical protein
VILSNLQPLFGMIGLALGVAAVIYFGLKNDTSFLGDLRGEKYLNILRIVLYTGCSILTVNFLSIQRSFLMQTSFFDFH